MTGATLEALAALVEPAAATDAPVAPAVVAEHLARSFGSRHVLRDVTLTVPPGKALGIVGANGSGKTVLLRLLASVDRPTAGRASIHGDDTVRNAGRVRQRVGYVPEEPRLYEGITAQQYLEFVAKARGLGRQVRTASISTLLQVVSLEHLRHREVSAYSPGERRRLMVAAALLHEPDVLLLDDPLRGLDGQSRLEQIEVLRELRQIGTTLLMAVTRPEDVLGLCDEIAVLREGTLAWIGDQDAVERLSAPHGEASDAVRVRIDVLAGLPAAVTLLSQHRDVRDLEIEEGDGLTQLWFLYASEQAPGAAGLAGLLPQIVRAGTTVSHFGVEHRSPGNALAALLRAS